MDLLLQLIAKNVLNISPEAITKDLARNAVRERMQEAVPTIAAKMEARGFTSPHTTPKPVIRDALFRLWKAVVDNGEIADLLRDAQDDKVLAIVTPKIKPETTMTQAVAATMAAAVDVAF